MEEYKLLTTVLGIVLSVLGLIMAVFGVFITRIFSDISNRLLTLSENTSKLSASISGMNAIQASSDVCIGEIKAKCDERRKSIWNKIEEHGETLANHEIEIDRIKEKTK